MLKHTSSVNPFSRNPFHADSTAPHNVHPGLYRFDSYHLQQQTATYNSPPLTAGPTTQAPPPLPYLNKSHRAVSYQVTPNQQENVDDYRYGGYHSIQPNELFGPMNQYLMIKKLGWGQYSTVWLVFHKFTDEYLALKIIRSDRVYSLAALDEIKLLEKLKKVDSNEHLIDFKEWFWHKGPNGKHCCLVFELLGENLFKFLRQYQNKTLSGGLPLPLVQSLTKQILQGVNELHQNNLIHTDLKPENILIILSEQDKIELIERLNTSGSSQEEINFHEFHLQSLSQEPRRSSIRQSYSQQQSPLRSSVSSIGSIIYTTDKDEENENTEEEQESNYVSTVTNTNTTSNSSCVVSCSETDSDYDSEEESNSEEEEDDHLDLCYEESYPSEQDTFQIKIADLGNTCSTSHHRTFDIQTRQYRSPEAILQNQYGASTDLWSVGCIVFELISGAWLFNPRNIKLAKDEEQLMRIINLLAVSEDDISYLKQSNRLSKSVLSLLKVKDDRFDELLQKFNVEETEAVQIAELLRGMLQIQPKNRKTCLELLKSSDWLSGFLSQAEIEKLKEEDEVIKGWVCQE